MRPSSQAQQASRPALIQALLDAFRVPDLRTKILFTLAMLVIFRFLANVPIPGVVDRDALATLFEQSQLLGLLDIFSGGALQNFSIVALGVYPYITASIIMQLLVPAIPKLRELSREGEVGRQRVNQITHWLTVPMAAVQGYGQLLILQQAGVISSTNLGGSGLNGLAAIFTLAAGTMFLVWMGELITERGIGNGISIIIFGGIVATFPQLISQGFVEQDNMTGLVMFVAIAVAIIYLIVLFTEAQRRVPVQYGRSVFRGGRQYKQAGSSFIPIRVNSAGMIPLIFAFSLMIFPGTVASYFADPTSGAFSAQAAGVIQGLFDSTGLFYWAILFVLVVIFTFFYTLVVFQQQNLAESLQRNGGFIPGIRPGRPTAEYLNKVVLRITWGGALFLGFVAVIPYFATQLTDVRALTLSSTSLLIMVGVGLDTMRQLEAQLLMRQYEGFMR
jgi:preprotein translocase subunit SecY